MTLRTMDITQTPDRFLKHNSAHISLTCLPRKHEFKVFIFLLDETEMAQNNSLFVWKTSTCSCGRSNLINDMNQVTNLKSLGFIRERIANLLGVFSEVVLCDVDFCGFSRRRLPPPLILGNSLPNSFVTDGCWFSSISHFVKFTKYINDCIISFGAFSLFRILK